MKILLALLFLVQFLQTATFGGIETDISRTNRVILASGSWKPSEEQTQKALAAIQRFEDPGQTNQWKAAEIKKILAKSGHYRVQFTGFSLDGRRMISCNFFPAFDGKGKDPFYYWKRESVSVDDGGFLFWQAWYDPSTGKCTLFESNGYG